MDGAAPRTFRIAAVAVVAAATLALAACGGAGDTDDDASSSMMARISVPADAPYDAADVMFAQMMIPHHEQALLMAGLAEERGGPAVRRLATAIASAQRPEIVEMRRWLRSADQDEAGDADHMAMGHGMGGQAMPGMLGVRELNDLRDASGERFDRLFLTGMIAHHEGAVAMARQVLDSGRDPWIADLARSVERTQTAEIDRMRSMMATSSPAA